MAPGDRLPADHDRRLRADQEVGLLREESGHRRRGRADDRQDDGQLARRARSATSCRSATSSTRSSRASGPARRPRSRRSTTRCSAATSSIERFDEGQQGSERGTAQRRRACRDRERRARRASRRWKSAPVFRSRWLPYALVAPQIAITLVFFFWPAAQALYQSLLVQDAFGAQHAVRLVRQFQRRCSTTTHYLASFRVTAVFSRAGRRRSGLSISLVLAVFADRVVRGATVYKTLLIWPYAVAPAVAGVLWLFLFNPDARHRRATGCKRLGIDWNLLLNGDQALIAGRHRRGVEADQLQLPVLPRRAAVDPEVADRGGGDRRRRAGAALLRRSCSRCCRRRRSSCSSSTSSTRSSTRSRSSTRRRSGGPGPGDGDPRLQGLPGRLQGARLSAARRRSRWS